MSRLIVRAAAWLSLLMPLTALAGQPVDVEVFDRTAGRILPVYWHAGERHIAGEPGHEYEIRILNRGYGRVLAVTSVDGVNVITGHTASPAQSGYVLDPDGSVEIDGWRKSMAEVAAFYFTSLPDSYAARTGRPDNVGVIGVALFCEKVDYPAPLYRQSAAEPDAASSAPAEERESASGARARSDAPQSKSSTFGRLADDSRLGTGHGQRRDSGATYVNFQRASEEPESVIRIYYDSKRNLMARGIIPKPRHRYAYKTPDAFPGGFVPDP